MRFKQFCVESRQDEYLKYALPQNIRSAITRKGAKIFQIGGAVRDSLINKISKDLDIIVVGVDLKELEQILKQFGKVDAVGKSFGILKFSPRHFSKGEEPIDVSVPRVDSKSTGDGHKDFKIELGKHISLRQDQLRRDFWMNALARDIETGKIIDVDGKGMVDIKNKQVRMISPVAFKEDPLRILRGIQFASRFGFKIEKETMDEMKKNVSKIKTVSKDRFEEELKKLFTKSKTPSVGIKYMDEIGVTKELFGSLKHAKSTLDAIDKLPKDKFLAFLTLFFNDIGTPSEVSDAISQIRPSNDTKRIVSQTATFIQSPSTSNVDLVMNTLGFREDTLENIDIVTGKGIRKRLADLRSKGIPTSIKELSVKGDELNVPKHERGNKLKSLLLYAIENKTNDKEELLKQ